MSAPWRHVSGGDTCVWGRHMCVWERHMCVWGRHMCVWERHMCVWERPSRCYILISPPCFFPNPFFLGLAYVFSKSPFSPYRIFVIPLGPHQKKILHGISTCFFFGSCLCFFRFPFFLPKENCHPPRVSKNLT